MLGRSHRLRHTSDFERVRRHGKSWADRRVVLCICPNDLENSRYGFIASKRVGNAVVRNRSRRLMREAIRLQMDLVKPGWDVVLIARRGQVGAGFVDVEESVSRLLLRADLYRDDASSADQEA